MTSPTDRILLAMRIKQHDPVCGMNIRPAQAAGTSEYRGRTIYFCADACKQEFDANPERYG